MRNDVPPFGDRDRSVVMGSDVTVAPLVRRALTAVAGAEASFRFLREALADPERLEPEWGSATQRELHAALVEAWGVHHDLVRIDSDDAHRLRDVELELEERDPRQGWRFVLGWGIDVESDGSFPGLSDWRGRKLLVATIDQARRMITDGRLELTVRDPQGDWEASRTLAMEVLRGRGFTVEPTPDGLAVDPIRYEHPRLGPLQRSANWNGMRSYESEEGSTVDFTPFRDTVWEPTARSYPGAMMAALRSVVARTLMPSSAPVDRSEVLAAFARIAHGDPPSPTAVDALYAEAVAVHRRLVPEVEELTAETRDRLLQVTGDGIAVSWADHHSLAEVRAWAEGLAAAGAHRGVLYVLRDSLDVMGVGGVMLMGFLAFPPATVDDIGRAVYARQLPEDYDPGDTYDWTEDADEQHPVALRLATDLDVPLPDALLP